MEAAPVFHRLLPPQSVRPSLPPHGSCSIHGGSLNTPIPASLDSGKNGRNGRNAVILARVSMTPGRPGRPGGQGTNIRRLGGLGFFLQEICLHICLSAKVIIHVSLPGSSIAGVESFVELMVSC